MAKIVITANYFSHDDPAIFEELKEGGFEVTDKSALKLNPASSEDEIFEAVKGFDAALVGLERYTPALLQRLAASGLKCLSRCGIGYDSIDTEACRRFGITLARAHGSVEGAVGEHVLAYILYFAKQLHVQNAEMHRGIWNASVVPGAKTRTLGLVGFGGIGKEIAKRAAPFGMNLLYYCRHPDEAFEKEYGVKYADLDTLLAESDYVSVNVPLTPETRGMFGAAEYAKMKEGAVLINIARGPVCDYAALADALKSGHLSGAAVDVFDHEPCTDSPLIDCPTALLTPHTAANTSENLIFNSRVASQNAMKWLAGTLSGPAKVV